MQILNNVLYADVGKLLDFKEPKYALDEDHVVTQVHLYAPFIRLGVMDSAINYIEVDKSEVK